MLVSSCLLLSPVKLVGGGAAPLLSHIDSDHSPDEQRCKSVPKSKTKTRITFQTPIDEQIQAEPCFYWRYLDAIFVYWATCKTTHFTNFATSINIMFYFGDNRYHKLGVLGVLFG